VTDSVNYLVIIISKDDNNIAAVQFKIEHFDVLSLNSSLIIFIRT